MWHPKVWHKSDDAKEEKEKEKEKEKKINYEVPLLDSEAVPQPRCKNNVKNNGQSDRLIIF